MVGYCSRECRLWRCEIDKFIRGYGSVFEKFHNSVKKYNNKFSEESCDLVLRHLICKSII